MKIGSLGHLIKDVRRVQEDLLFSEFKKVFTRTTQHYFPVINSKAEMTGIFSSNDIREVIFSQHIEDLVVMKDIMISELIRITPAEDLYAALLKMTRKNIDALPVVSEKNPKELMGMIYRRDIIAHYNAHIRKTRNQP